jgi:hypothetical protein
MKKYAEGGLSRRDMPSDLVNFDALPDTPPPGLTRTPKNKPAKTKSKGVKSVDKAQGGMRMNQEYSGKVKRYAKGGVTRADGMCTKGHTKGRMV